MANHEFDVVVAGGSIAGMRTAHECAVRGYHTAAIDPRFGSTAPSRIDSAPIVSGKTAAGLGITLEEDYLLNNAEVDFRLFGNLISEIMIWRGRRSGFYNAPYISDLRNKVDSLVDPRVVRINDHLKDIETFDDFIQSAGENDTYQGAVVIDATGRNAQIARKYKEHGLGEVAEQSVAQPSKIYAIYADLGTNTQTGFLPPHSVCMGGLMRGVAIAACPITPSPDQSLSRATHIVMIEGDTQVINTTTGSVKGQGHERRLKIMQELAKSSRWGEFLTTISPDDIIAGLSFEYTSARNRTVDSNKFMLVGDARQHENPSAGRGIHMAITHSHQLAGLLDTHDDLHKATDEYNRKAVQSARQWEKSATRHWRKRQVLYRFTG